MTEEARGLSRTLQYLPRSMDVNGGKSRRIGKPP
jgi:hypothetical protein